jgi:hypothetical protein
VGGLRKLVVGREKRGGERKSGETVASKKRKRDILGPSTPVLAPPPETTASYLEAFLGDRQSTPSSAPWRCNGFKKEHDKTDSSSSSSSGKNPRWIFGPKMQAFLDNITNSTRFTTWHATTSTQSDHHTGSYHLIKQTPPALADILTRDLCTSEFLGPQATWASIRFNEQYVYVYCDKGTARRMNDRVHKKKDHFHENNESYLQYVRKSQILYLQTFYQACHAGNKRQLDKARFPEIWEFVREIGADLESGKRGQTVKKERVK